MVTQESQKEIQISFRTSPENRRLARIEAAKCNMSLNEWIKFLVESKLPNSTPSNSK
ncbi:toxin-antitoxin system HicB family antitoxin [Acinetobacter sp. 1000160]|uniref:toxin-antitoxin system HicB family antitoxin n=1 Tax=Acinetobacter sp. 1000160 TaxID=1310800 RepID=UPI000445281B|nr:toxin-antitoxin system HicB family antitoxin [Acinetobacter sp. 1000160]EYT17785.1 hicB family protein [Acinetobacter sp. 1000160]